MKPLGLIFGLLALCLLTVVMISGCGGTVQPQSSFVKHHEHGHQIFTALRLSTKRSPHLVQDVRKSRASATAPSSTVGGVLTANAGTWTGSPIAYTYIWQDCNSSGSSCTNIASATTTTSSATDTYTIANSDVNFYIRVGVLAMNSDGRSATTYSTLTSEITGGTSSGYTAPPTLSTNQWYWEISPSQPGLAGLPATSAAYPAPGSANIWDTDLFQDSNTANAGIPTGASPVVTAIHAAGHYSICYVEAGAYQVGFPDDSDFATADYGGVGDTATEMQGYPNEYWFDLTGFANYVAGNSSTLTGAAVNIAAGLNDRFAWCKLEGQDAVEPDDLDGYTNDAQSGVRPWGMTQADSAGFERWLAYDVHANGLAVFLKNDPANEPAAVTDGFDGAIIEECNYYNDPCSGSGGDETAMLAAGKPVLNAEYSTSPDDETTSKFCAADEAANIVGALFDVSLDGATYQPCQQ